MEIFDAIASLSEHFVEISYGEIAGLATEGSWPCLCPGSDLWEGDDFHHDPPPREPGELVVSWSFERPAFRTRTRKNKMKWPTTRPPHLMLRVLMRGSDTTHCSPAKDAKFGC